jgi:hypothetical protein
MVKQAHNKANRWDKKTELTDKDAQQMIYSGFLNIQETYSIDTEPLNTPKE